MTHIANEARFHAVALLCLHRCLCQLAVFLQQSFLVAAIVKQVGNYGNEEKHGDNNGDDQHQIETVGSLTMLVGHLHLSLCLLDIFKNHDTSDGVAQTCQLLHGF